MAADGTTGFRGGDPEHIGPILGRVMKNVEKAYLERGKLYSGEEPSLTCGEYALEVDSAKAFDAAVEQSGLFKIWCEVPGELLQPLPGKKEKDFRIDRILCPAEKLRAAGWTKGLIGVELKRSGEKVGPPLSQCLDYLRAAWTLPSGVRVLIDYCFLWPLQKCGGPTVKVENIPGELHGPARKDQRGDRAGVGQHPGGIEGGHRRAKGRAPGCPDQTHGRDSEAA